MKPYLESLLQAPANPLLKRNQVREYLQARVLQGLQDSGAFLTWAFHGGTALRFLYRLPRFSEDLDFSLMGAPGETGFGSRLEAVKRQFHAENYRIELAIKEQKTVQSAFIRFPGLLHELRLSAREEETLSVRVELDTHPPEGARLETTAIRKHVLLRLSHHDRGTLLAGKINALLTREFLKGRDVYDLVWYLSDPEWPSPNFDYLNAALGQFDWPGPLLSSENWREVLIERLKPLSWQDAARDVQPFLERAEDTDWVSWERCREVIGA